MPATKYILLVNDEGDYVGIFNLRHRLTDFLRNGPGHIGYGIAREYRGHGYATAGLKLTLAKARELGIEEAYLSVHKTNPASLAVQQHCGARIDHEDGILHTHRHLHGERWPLCARRLTAPLAYKWPIINRF